jgi:hypothetical protein
MGGQPLRQFRSADAASQQDNAHSLQAQSLFFLISGGLIHTGHRAYTLAHLPFDSERERAKKA